MVTFSCDNCNDTVKKPKANQHAQRCRGSLTCIDCSKTFWSGEWNVHNACISEAEAYQGALYKPTKKELKRKAAEAAAESAKTSDKTTTSSKATDATVSEKPATTAPEEVKAPKIKKSKREEAETVKSKQNLELLTSVITADAPISIYKALKLLKAQNKLDKDGEKALLKDVCIVKDAQGNLKLV